MRNFPSFIYICNFCVQLSDSSPLFVTISVGDKTVSEVCSEKYMCTGITSNDFICR